MKKRLLTVLLAVCLVLALGTVSALAVDTLPTPTDGVITLEDDVEVNSIPLNETGETVIDLNGHTLTYTGAGTIAVNSGQTLTVTDSSGTGEGELISSGITAPSQSFLGANEGGTINASNITVRTLNTATAFFASGNAAAVNIDNCDVYGGYYCVGTNSGALENYGVDITLTNSTFECLSTDNDNCAVMLNVEGTLTIDNCIITGDRQAVFVRAGDASISNLL